MRFAVLVLVPSIAFADRVAVPSAHTASAPPAVVAPMPMPRPMPVPQPPPVPADIAKLGKAIGGTYACKGNRMTPTGQSTPLKSSLVVKLDLSDAWIAATWTEGATKFVDYRTFDGVAKQWTRFQMFGDGSHAQVMSLGEKAGEWLWEGSVASSTGTVQLRHHEQWNGKDLKIWGEQQLGGTWQKSYEASCKRQ
jgi:hypothetical protein